MAASEPRGTDTLVRSRGVDAHSFVVANGGRGGALVCVVEAAGTRVAGRTRACVAPAGQRAAESAVGAGAGQTAVLVLAPRPCPSSGTLALVLVEGQQGADAPVGARVVGVTGGVLGDLAVLPRVAQRAGACGASQHRHAGQHGDGAVPTVQAVAGVTRVLVLAVLTQKAWGAPAVFGAIAKGQTRSVVNTGRLIIHTLQGQGEVDEAEDDD